VNQDLFPGGWLQALAPVFSQSITFQAQGQVWDEETETWEDSTDPLGARSPLGVRTDSWLNVESLTDLPCKVANASGRGAQVKEELEGVEFERLQRLKRCLIQGYYPAIRPKLRAVVDGVAYDVISVQHDSHLQLTRVLLEERKPV
jgi:hypothetical protein